MTRLGGTGFQPVKSGLLPALGANAPLSPPLPTRRKIRSRYYFRLKRSRIALIFRCNEKSIPQNLRRHRRRRLSRLPSHRPAFGAWPQGDRHRQLCHRQRGQHRAPRRQPQLQVHPAGRHGIYFPRCARELRLALCLAGQPGGLPGTAHPDTEGRLPGHPQGPRTGQAQKSPFSHRLHFRDLRGPPRASPPEEYWGNVNTIGPRGCYDESKRFAEAITMAYHREHQVATRIVRIFNTYGPRMRLNDGAWSRPSSARR